MTRFSGVIENGSAEQVASSPGPRIARVRIPAAGRNTIEDSTTARSALPHDIAGCGITRLADSIVAQTVGERKFAPRLIGLPGMASW
jgi:hypothetical protein